MDCAVTQYRSFGPVMRVRDRGMYFLKYNEGAEDWCNELCGNDIKCLKQLTLVSGMFVCAFQLTIIAHG